MSRRLEAGHPGEQEEQRHCPQCGQLLHFRLGTYECLTCGTVAPDAARTPAPVATATGTWQDSFAPAKYVEPEKDAAIDPLSPVKLWCYRIFIAHYIFMYGPLVLMLVAVGWLAFSPGGFCDDTESRNLFIALLAMCAVGIGISIIRAAFIIKLFRQILTGEASGLNQAVCMFAALAWGMAVLGVGFVFATTGQLIGEPEVPAPLAWRAAGVGVALLEGVYCLYVSYIVYRDVNST
jgi:hypothetical protein